jgi:hypothetical protein
MVARGLDFYISKFSDGAGKCKCADCTSACQSDDGHEHKSDHCILVGKCDDSDYFQVDEQAAFQQVNY